MGGRMSGALGLLQLALAQAGRTAQHTSGMLWYVNWQTGLDPWILQGTACPPTQAGQVRLLDVPRVLGLRLWPTALTRQPRSLL